MKKKYLLKKILLLIIFSGIIAACNIPKSKELDNKSWALNSFIKVDSINPVLQPNTDTKFLCPVRGSNVSWEAKDVFNPAAIVKDDKVYLLYRAEDFVGKYNGTSRIGLATSEDGLHFKRLPEPIFYPQNDEMKEFEWEGGCEDPRIVEDELGTYYMTYSAYDGDKARLFIATSTDLLKWTKHGSVFEKAYNGKYSRVWSKSGSIVCKRKDSRMVATRINGKYWMYFGDTNLFLAHSDDLINWIPLEQDTLSGSEKTELFPVMSVRKNKFDSGIVEPGPPAILTDKGILLIYNSSNSAKFGDPTLADNTYAAGQVLFDKNDPSRVIDRLDNTFFKPEKPYEIAGQVNHVCFLEGLVYFKGKWFMYYGTADSKIAVAVMGK
ncbi:MAG: glycoside hydrolase family 130 protein [Bacteroidota bacterium]|nr:glycoside hydrolase family 130 protein [Bacteroidota bacterium]